MRGISVFILMCAVVSLSGIVSAQDAPAIAPSPSLDPRAGYVGPPPRWREGGTPYDANQRLTPYAVSLGNLRDYPDTGIVRSPAEYAPIRGVLFRYFRDQWPLVVRDCVVALTKPAEHDEIAYVVVANSTDRTDAESRFKAGGADMSKVVFITAPGDSVWLRDYGPHFIFQDEAIAIADSHYYPERTQDNFIPVTVGTDALNFRAYPMGLYYSGGNFQPGPDRQGFITALVRRDNPTGDGWNDERIAEVYQRFQGIDTLHIMPQLPDNVDGTGHIDMWMYIIDEDDVIISKFIAGSNETAIKITEEAVPYMEGLGFKVHRTPAWNTGGGSIHWTYTNAFRVNNRIFIPKYGGGNSQYKDEDADVLNIYTEAAGEGVEIVQIECSSIIPAAGAIHCIVMQVPRHESTAPKAHVVAPDGGELWISGTMKRIAWVASDENNKTIPQVDLYYSLDDGTNWEFIATTTNIGGYDWVVPVTPSATARVKVIAVSDDLDTGEAVSASAFEIARGRENVYDFKTGGGTDKVGYGSSALNWSKVDGKRQPVTKKLNTITQNAWERLASDDANGNDNDSKRYISQSPGSTRSTHTFEFTLKEDVRDINGLDVSWVGYGDNCTQAELYLWNVVAANWGDELDQLGQNRYCDSWAGNRDDALHGYVRDDFGRFIDADGLLTLMIYADRVADRSFHDYVSVTVIQKRTAGDTNCDNAVDFGDIDSFVAALTGRDVFESESPGCPYLNADVNDDASVDFNDIDAFIECLISGCE